MGGQALLSPSVLVMIALCLAGSVSAVYTGCVAHRGASGNFPENTIRAFSEAEKQGADFIEFDTLVTLDGVVWSLTPLSPAKRRLTSQKEDCQPAS